jgi:hypothetical protein
MRNMNKTIINAEEPKNEKPQNKDTYRAPRLVALGSAVGLVQSGCIGEAIDAPSGVCNKVRVR